MVHAFLSAVYQCIFKALLIALKSWRVDGIAVIIARVKLNSPGRCGVEWVVEWSVQHMAV